MLFKSTRNARTQNAPALISIPVSPWLKAAGRSSKSTVTLEFSVESPGSVWKGVEGVESAVAVNARAMGMIGFGVEFCVAWMRMTPPRLSSAAFAKICSVAKFTFLVDRAPSAMVRLIP